MVLLGFFLCLPAGEALGRCLRRPKLRPVHSLVALVAVAIAIRAGSGLVPSLAFGTGWDPAEESLVDVLAREDDGGGRTLVESTFEPLPAARDSERTIPFKRFALLPLRTGREFLGYYFTGAHSVQRYASFGRGGILGHVLARLDDGEARELFSRFAITRIVACTPPSVRHLVRLRGALKPPRSLGGCWMFPVRDPDPSLLLEGRGEVFAELDRIQVRNAEGERLLLKYHWMPTLRTEPPLRLEEVRRHGMPVGFIAVRPGGVRDFAIVQKRSLGAIERVVAGLRARLLP